MITPDDVTDADVKAFYGVFFARPEELEHVPLVGLDPQSPHGELLMQRYRAAIANDRNRVTGRAKNA